MSKRDTYPAGVPCWVETLQGDEQAATAFYTGLFGWELSGPGPMPDGGEYYVATVDGRDVAGIGSSPGSPAEASAEWMTFVAVEHLEPTVTRAVDAGGAVVVSPTEAPPVGSLAAVTDPGGATIGLWQAQTRQGAQLVNQPGAWAMSVLHCADAEAAAAFYGHTFGWVCESFGPPDAGMWLWRLPGYVGGEPQQPVPRDVVGVMASAAEGPDEPPRWSVDFWVSDTDAAATRATELGGSVPMAPHDAPGFRRAVVADPHGAEFSISQLVP
ncbi:MAG: VOC family protein [Pseudonocardiales bacterium]|nr:MAG: VOC family protein [Pseudonocardiales bacterium]